MIRRMNAHLHTLRLALRQVLGTPFASLLNILVIGITLALPGGLYLILDNLQAGASRLAEAPQISVFLVTSAGKDKVEAIDHRLSQQPSVSKYEFVSREQALDRLKQDSQNADILAGLERNPLPDAFILHPASTDPLLLEALAKEIQTWPGVEQAKLDSDWVRKLDAALRLGHAGVAILALLLGIALIAVTFNTIRLQILTRRDEIEVARLIGATAGYVRRPFLYFGLLQGLLGGLTAWLIIMASVYLLNQQLSALTQLYASDFLLSNLNLADSLALLTLSSSLGWAGAWLSVAQYLWRIDHR